MALLGCISMLVPRLSFLALVLYYSFARHYHCRNCLRHKAAAGHILHCFVNIYSIPNKKWKMKNTLRLISDNNFSVLILAPYFFFYFCVSATLFYYCSQIQFQCFFFVVVFLKVYSTFEMANSGIR